MDPTELKTWRRAERERLIAHRVALSPDTVNRARARIDAALEATFPQLATGVVGFCWPIQNEYDARHLLARMRARGAITALPVVLAPRTPLEFREWHRGVALARGVYDIPYPATGPALDPDVMIVPMNGFDRGGYRLGYGGGFFDRTLAARAAMTALAKPLVIGVAYEFAALATIHPQPYDIPMDYVVTEEGVYLRDPVAGLIPAPDPH